MVKNTGIFHCENNRNCYTLRTLLCFFGLLILFNHCASPVAPTGGNKDTAQPQILKIVYTQSKAENTVTIFFNENIHAKGQVIVSPKLNGKAILNQDTNAIVQKINKNTITLKLPKHTATIYLSNNIADLNENNKYLGPSVLLTNDTGEIWLQNNTLLEPKDKLTAWINEQFSGYFIKDSNFYYQYLSENLEQSKIHFAGLNNNLHGVSIVLNDNNNLNIDKHESYNYFLANTSNIDTINVRLYPPHYCYKNALLTYDTIPFVTTAPCYSEWIINNRILNIIGDTILFNHTDENVVKQQLGIDSFIQTKIKLNKNKPQTSYYYVDKIKDTFCLIDKLELFKFQEHRSVQKSNLLPDSLIKKSIQIFKGTINNPTDSVITIRLQGKNIDYIDVLGPGQSKSYYLPEDIYKILTWINQTTVNKSYNIMPNGFDFFNYNPLFIQESFCQPLKPYVINKQLENTLILPALVVYNKGVITK